MYSLSRAISQGCTQSTPTYIKSTLIVSHHVYSPSKAISPSHTYIHKIVPYIVACISPYKGQSYVFSFQSNHRGTYPSHAHIHKIVPYIVACISPYKVDLMYSPSRAISHSRCNSQDAWPRTNSAIISTWTTFT